MWLLKMRTLLMLITTLIAIDAVQIPDVLKLCPRDDLNFNGCLKNNIQSALKGLNKGLPEFKLKPLDPYLLKDMKIEYTNGEFVGRAFLENFNTFGMSSAKVQNVRMNLHDDLMKLEIDMSNKRIFIDGHFRGEIGIGSFLLSTQSYFNNTLSDVTWTWKILGEKTIINGNPHIVVKEFGMRPEVGHMMVTLPDVFKGSPGLAKLAQDLSQAYWRVIYQELLPIVEKTWNKIGVRVCNKIFKKIPYEELFPTSKKKINHTYLES